MSKQRTSGRNKTLFFVKLTDSCLKAVEDYLRCCQQVRNDTDFSPRIFVRSCPDSLCRFPTRLWPRPQSTELSRSFFELTGPPPQMGPWVLIPPTRDRTPVGWSIRHVSSRYLRTVSEHSENLLLNTRDIAHNFSDVIFVLLLFLWSIVLIERWTQSSTVPNSYLHWYKGTAVFINESDREHVSNSWFSKSSTTW